MAGCSTTFIKFTECHIFITKHYRVFSNARRWAGVYFLTTGLLIKSLHFSPLPTQVSTIKHCEQPSFFLRFFISSTISQQLKVLSVFPDTRLLLLVCRITPTGVLLPHELNNRGGVGFLYHYHSYKPTPMILLACTTRHYVMVWYPVDNNSSR